VRVVGGWISWRQVGGHQRVHRGIPGPVALPQPMPGDALEPCPGLIREMKKRKK
jgi:hypothetical protein